MGWVRVLTSGPCYQFVVIVDDGGWSSVTVVGVIIPTPSTVGAGEQPCLSVVVEGDGGGGGQQCQATVVDNGRWWWWLKKEQVT